MSSNRQSITNIFNQIDELDDVRTMNELINKLKPILAELAYYSITGDGAVMEMRENWHSNFTGYIREAVQNERNDAVSNERHPSRDDGRRDERRKHREKESSRNLTHSHSHNSIPSHPHNSIPSHPHNSMQSHPHNSMQTYSHNSIPQAQMSAPNNLMIPQQDSYYQRPSFYQTNSTRDTLPSSLDSIMRGTHMSFNNL